MEEDSDSLEVSWNINFDIVERDGEVLAGFESPGEKRMFDDLYKPDRWLEYLLDPGDGSSPVSEGYHKNTAALQLVGLTLAEEMLEYEETRDTVLEYQEELEEMTVLGYSEELRSYASDILMKMEEN